MIELNRKILGVCSVLILVAMLATPLVGEASAEKGQTKQDFKLFFQGLPTPGEINEADGNTIHKGSSYNVLADFYVQIGADGATEDLAKEYLDYTAVMDWIVHTKPEQFFTVRVVETISIYNDAVTHDETTLRGALEIMAIGTNRVDNGGTFVGFGTGEFEGVKIQGTSAPLQIVFTNPNPPNYYTQLTRTGTVMGWPT